MRGAGGRRGKLKQVLAWELEWGNKRDFLQTLRRTSGQTPKALQNKPSLTQWTVEYYEAFHVLMDSRVVGQAGIGPIPLTEIKAYLDMTGITDVEEVLVWIRMIRALDRVYIQHTNRQIELKRKRAGSVGRGRR